MQLEWAGTCRGRITEFGIRQADQSEAVAISLKAEIDDCYDFDKQSWDDYREQKFEVSGDIWIVKKDGSVNENAVQSLVAFAGWDGNLASVADGTWKPAPCAFVVNKEEYKGTVRYKISFVNDYDRQPGANVGNVTADKAKALQDRYGAQLRAVAGNVARATAPTPAGKPAIPPPKKTAAKKSEPQATEAPKVKDEDIPF